MRRLIAAMLCVLITVLPVLAVPDAMPTLEQPDTLTVGGAIQIRFTVPEAGECSLTILNGNGENVSVVVDPYNARQGMNDVWWNGTWHGVAVPAGAWILCLTYRGQKITVPLCILDPDAAETITDDMDTPADSEDMAEVGEPEEAWAEGNPDDLAEEWTEENPDDLPEEWAEENPDDLPEEWAEENPDDVEEAGEETADLAKDGVIGLTGVEQNQFTPSFSSPYAGEDKEINYWTLPMDITDTEAVWKMLTDPIVILDNGKKNMEKTQVVVRSEPDEESVGIGMCTAATQGVHVLERGDEWSLIECYSSSFHDSPVINWNTLIQGYVPTKYLKEVTPNQEIGIVIDKLTQRLYLFHKGEMVATLLVSTGVSNPRQPYNETRSGEFLMASKVGTFASDNMRCALAIRFNDGDLLHEVPYTVLRDGGRNYKNNEPKLGKRASHGCIRVQRKKTPEGYNMQWIWDHKKKNMKMVIWEDWQGRQMSYPSDDTVLYYNPNGGESYHSASTCYSVSLKKTFEPFLYGELDTEPYASLTRCEYCTPVIRKSEIDEINAEHAIGGDHDPVLTEYRKDCPMSNAEWKKIQPKN